MTAGRVASVTLFNLSLLLYTTFLSAEPPIIQDFTLNLIPRHSLNPPISNPYDDPRYAPDQISLNRSTFNPKIDDIAASGRYIMNVSIGTPPFPILAAVDMGSNLIWTQCKPCPNCHNQSTPLFDPTKSFTYKPVPCSAPKCKSSTTEFNSSCDRSKNCEYSFRFVDGSTSDGSIATETLTLGPLALPKMVFGCGFHNQSINKEPLTGVIGLGNGPDSLIGRMHNTIGGKFSYCLVPRSLEGSKSSQINFGKNAVVSGHGVVSTPLYSKESSNYYYINLEAITVGNVRIPYPKFHYHESDGKGNTVMNANAELLALPHDLYFGVEAELENQVGAKRVFNDDDNIKTCFESATFKAPEIVMHFEGADVKLNDFNVFLKLKNGLTCFAADFTVEETTLYGNLAQMNFLIGFDRVKQSVSFKPTNCGRSLKLID